MNYLGHLFLSNNHLELMICNLHGDFIKGRTFDHFDSSIQRGIILHRAIDFFTDSHPINLELKKLCYSELPKVSGLAIDLYYDHLLAKNWNLYHHLNLTTFLDNFFDFSSPLENDMHPNFTHFLKNLRFYQWIRHYSSYWGLKKMCNGVSSKLSFSNTLTEAPYFFKKNQIIIEQAFEQFILDAKKEFND